MAFPRILLLLIKPALLTLLLPSPEAAAFSSPIVVNGIDAMPQGAADGRGIMNEAVSAALERVGLRGELRFLPWKRAQMETAQGKDILITGLSRTRERESKFTWLFPVFSNERAFTTLGETYSDFAAARASLTRIAVTSGSAQYDILMREGFSPAQIRLVQIEHQEVVPTMLLDGRVDAWFSAINEARYFLKGELAVSEFVVGPPVGVATDQYVACSRNCDPELAAKLRKAGEEMRTDGTLDAILRRCQ